MRAYVFPCNEGLGNNPQCGHVQEKYGSWGSWDDQHPRGQVGEIAGCYPEVAPGTEARDPFGPVVLDGDPTAPAYNLSRWRWAAPPPPPPARRPRPGPAYKLSRGGSPPPPLPLVPSGHAASLTPY
jgi:hypothetical protein